MQLKYPLQHLLFQLKNALEELTDEQFCNPIKVLSNGSIGQHTRHILEFFIELQKGYASGHVDYDKRTRDSNIETHRAAAAATIDALLTNLSRPNRDIVLNVEYGTEDEPTVKVQTNYFRELVYNMEHMVHHMALIRIGIEAVTGLELPREFGVASSTLRYRQTCVQ